MRDSDAGLLRASPLVVKGLYILVEMIAAVILCNCQIKMILIGNRRFNFGGKA